MQPGGAEIAETDGEIQFLNARARCLLWGVVIVRLIVPPLPETRWTLPISPTNQLFNQKRGAARGVVMETCMDDCFLRVDGRCVV